ncbi:MAG: hypothetical protein ACI9MR_000547 [Myxococcota bacterium]|jgi:hypothetical protein
MYQTAFRPLIAGLMWISAAALVVAPMMITACGSSDADTAATAAPAKPEASAAPGPSAVSATPAAAQSRNVRAHKPPRVIAPTPKMGITIQPSANEEPDDAPHVDRALRAIVEPDGDIISGPGFAIAGVPDDFTVYNPVVGRRRSVFLVFDAAMEHVVTISVVPARAAAPKPLGPTLAKDAVKTAPLPAFSIWKSSFAASQKKKGPGTRHDFRSNRWTYQVDTLVDLPWLLAGWEITDK